MVMPDILEKNCSTFWMSAPWKSKEKGIVLPRSPKKAPPAPPGPPRLGKGGPPGPPGGRGGGWMPLGVMVMLPRPGGGAACAPAGPAGVCPAARLRGCGTYRKELRSGFLSAFLSWLFLSWLALSLDALSLDPDACPAGGRAGGASCATPPTSVRPNPARAHPAVQQKVRRR